MTGRKKRAAVEYLRAVPRVDAPPARRLETLGLYILEGHTPVPCDDALLWWDWFKDGERRRVGKTEVGAFTVYTTFLGIDHNFGRLFAGIGEPLLFETMVDYPRHTPIEGPRDHGWLDLQKQYSTWEQAEAGHERAVLFIRNNYDSFMAQRDVDDLPDDDA